MRLLTQANGSSRPRVSSVAYAMGFSDDKTFSRAFKRRFGFLPREAGPFEFMPANSDRTSILLSWINALAA